MIIQNNGQSRSLISYKDYVKQINSMYSILSSEEKKVVDTMMRDVIFPTDKSVDRYSELMGIAYAMEFKGVPVSPEEFYNSEYYLGATVEDIYPGLKRDLIEFAKGNYGEAIITGGLGYGKSYWTSLAILRLIYELSMMKDPAKTLGIASGTQLTIAMLSVNEITAREVMFQEIGMKIASSRYFTEEYKYRITKKEITFGGKGQSKIYIVPKANTDNSVIGLTVIGAIVDEINFMVTSKVSLKKSRLSGQKIKTRQEQIYGILVKRIKSRFLHNGKHLGKIFLLSSKLSADDFTASRINLSLNSNDIFVRDYTNWELKEHIKNKHSRDSFFVMVGTGSYQSKILKAKDIEYLDVDLLLNEGIEIIQVPRDVYDIFDTDIEKAIADYGGRIASSSLRFIKNPINIEKSFSKKIPIPYRRIDKIITKRKNIITKIDINNYIKNPELKDDKVYFYEETYVSKSGRNRFDFTNLCVKKFSADGSYYYEPKLNPNAIRFLHIDGSVSGDNTGISMGHIVKTEYTSDGDLVPFIIIDLAVAIEPPLNGEIEYDEIRRMVYDLRDVYNFNLVLVSMDMVEKATNLQHFRKKGFETKYISVDKSKLPYLLVKDLINQGRVKIHHSNILKKELKSLEKTIMGKIDHPDGGSKDIADAVAGVIAGLITEFILELNQDTKKKKFIQSINNTSVLDFVMDIFVDEEEDEKDTSNDDAISDLERLFKGDVDSLEIIKSLSKKERTELLARKQGDFFPEYEEKIETDISISPFDF